MTRTKQKTGLRALTPLQRQIRREIIAQRTSAETLETHLLISQPEDVRAVVIRALARRKRRTARKATREAAREAAERIREIRLRILERVDARIEEQTSQTCLITSDFQKG